MQIFVDEIENQHWSFVNLYFSAYKYLFEKLIIPLHGNIQFLNLDFFLTDLVLLELDQLDPLDVLPPDYNIALIN